MLPDLFMVFDVESIGLHGEGFAASYVVVSLDGTICEEATFACNPVHAAGLEENRKWVIENIPKIAATHAGPFLVREEFWKHWLRWKEKGAVLVADCAWPVEDKFLLDTINDNLAERQWKGPYPLLDLSSILLAHGHDPLEIHERLPNELPVHHPLMDARQSARILITALTNK